MDDYTSGTFNKSYGYGDNDDSSVEEHSEYEGEFPLDPKTDKPRVLILGLRRAGKSSIQKVVFSKMSPNETLFLESSNKMSKDEVSTSSFVSFSIWNYSGQMDFFDNHVHDEIFNGFIGALVFVIDAQEDYTEALTKLYHTVIRVHKINPTILFEIFIHKVDCVSEENRLEIQRDIYQRLTDDLQDGGYDGIKFNYHLTSIYDHSIFEAFSKVVQKLIPQLHELEQTLNMFISNSRIEKAFLFDVLSKIYIATDGSPVDVQTYELCCDMIDVVIDISGIYGVKEEGDPNMFDGNSTSIIKLNNQTVLYLREVNSYLALVCILREESFERQGLIDYNFNCFKQAIQELFKDKNESQIKLNGTHSILNDSPVPTIDSD